VGLADILRRHESAYLATHGLSVAKARVWRAIVACRTAALGGHVEVCNACGVSRHVYHSCRNRHCPLCQTRAKEAWLVQRRRELLPTPYFHLVFTLPHQLNPLIGQNQKALYDLLFASAAATLLSFGRNNLGAQLGVTAVLHTWSQTLLDHYHLHCIVTGGGPALDGRRWVPSRPDYLFHVGALSTVFRAKFCEGLQRLYAQGHLQFHGQLQPLGQERHFQALMREATRQGWVVYSKRPFAGPQQVLAYLSRYTHRVGLSNRRLLQLDRRAGTVTFDYKDYADGARHKPMQLGLQEFIRRLRLHFLPPRFVKIRHYGLLANCGRQQRLERARALLGPGQPTAPAPAPTLRTLPVCPHCGWAALFLVRVVPPQRFQSPPARMDSS